MSNGKLNSKTKKMKKIFFIISILSLLTTACSTVDFDINEEYERAEITGVELYNRNMSRADKSSDINSEAGTINVILKPNQDITDLKIAVSASTGVEIVPTMAVGFQDFSSPKTYEITSPNKTIKKVWTITVQNP